MTERHRPPDSGSPLLNRLVLGALHVLLAYRWLQSLLPTGGKRRQALRDLESEDASRRAAAAVRLGELRHPSAVLPLLRHLDDGEEAVRRECCGALARIGRPALDPVLERLPQAAAPTRALLLRVLGIMGDSAGTAAVIAALADPEPAVRAAAAEALERIAPARAGASEALDDAAGEELDPASAPELVRGLDDRQPSVRRASADALGRLGHRPAVPALRTLLREEAEDADVRGAAAVALGRLHADEAVDDLTWALGDEEVASDALTALLQLGRGLPELLGKLDTKGKGSRGQKSSRLRTLRALGTLGDPGAVGALLIATADRAAEVRTTAVHALSELVRKVDHGARPADWPRLREDIGAGIEKLFKDPAPSVRVAALNAGVVRPTLATLAWLAKDPDEEVRYQAVGSMKHFGVEAIDLVTASLKDTDETVRAMAVDARAAMGDPAMVDALIAAAGDPAPRVRIQAAYALAPENKPWPAPRMPAIRETLLRILGDTDMTVRHAGAAAFGRLRDRDPAAVDALIAALRDPEPYVREQVVRSLADIGAKRALPAVLELESDPYPVIRDVVAMAAGNLKRYGR